MKTLFLENSSSFSSHFDSVFGTEDCGVSFLRKCRRPIGSTCGYITRENNRKYMRKKSQVHQTMLVISKFLRHHACDYYLRCFRVYWVTDRLGDALIMCFHFFKLKQNHEKSIICSLSSGNFSKNRLILTQIRKLDVPNT